jgi:bifunctional non-homologous end joining protein LigD
MSKRTAAPLKVGNRTLEVSNLDKVLYPAVGFTKGQVIDYYIRIGPVLLPHLKDRPLTLKRYPNGVDQMFFYEKRCPSHRPDWVRTAHIWSEGNNDYVDYCLANDLPTLVWAANLADLELHTSLAKSRNKERPTTLVFDLDPGAPATIVECATVAFWLKEVFDAFRLEVFAKTSGSKGLQLYVPLNTPVTYEQTKPFAQALAQRLEREHPREVVSKMQKNLRANKVFIDWSQNDSHKTTVCVYSLRAKERPTVSTPVTWGELEVLRRKKNPELVVFTSDAVLKRVDKQGDIFAPMLTLKQKLPKLET